MLFFDYFISLLKTYPFFPLDLTCTLYHDPSVESFINLVSLGTTAITLDLSDGLS